MENRQEDIAEALQGIDQGVAAEKVKKYLNDLEKAPLVIAITGESGSGKSTFVNALRELDDSDEDAASTDVVETTMEPIKYSLPKNSNIKLWDLPGVGTTKFTANEYLMKMEFERFDFFIIISSDRFRENDAKLAQEIQKMGKKFYFVRSKMDNSIQNDKRKYKKITEDEYNAKLKMQTLQRIRDNCTKELGKLGIQSPKVFLISSVALQDYDFHDFWKTLEKELPAFQRDVLLLALPNINLEVVNQKIEVLEGKIKWYALTSAGVAAVPIPGSSVAVDTAIILKFVNECQTSLGLTHDSLLRLSWVTKVPIEEIRKELKSPLAGVKVTAQHLSRIMAKSLAIEMAVEEGIRYVPFIGTSIAMCISGYSVYTCLQNLLKTLGEDAHRVFMKAMLLSTSV
ncbi:unnamed protein product [Knipowitschia caucasica]